jgi:hypothetical protein
VAPDLRPLPKSGHHDARHEPTLIAAAKSRMAASSPRGTFSQAELAGELVTRFTTRPRQQRLCGWSGLADGTGEMAAAGVSRYAARSPTSVTAGKRYVTNEYRFQLPAQRPVESPHVAINPSQCLSRTAQVQPRCRHL